MEGRHITNERSQLIERLKNRKYRENYVRASVNVNLPSQIRALRLGIPMTQKEFAIAAQMKQPRISAMEKPGATRLNIETLVRVAATCGVGLIVKFVPISEMLAWENGFSQDQFSVVSFEHDARLQSLPAVPVRATSGNVYRNLIVKSSAPSGNVSAESISLRLSGGQQRGNVEISMGAMNLALLGETTQTAASIGGK